MVGERPRTDWQYSTVDPSKPRRRSDQIVERVMDGDLVLYDLKHQRVHILNPTAALIWQLCDGEHSRTDMIATITELFPDSNPSAEEDIGMILRSVSVEGLLEV